MLQLVTFNLRCPCKSDGKNYFFDRLPWIEDKIRREKPTVLGFQEMTEEMYRALGAALPEYAFAGMGREADYRGESCRIAFLREETQLQAMDQFWLSPVPRQAGSRYEKQSICPRVCTWVKLYHPASGRRFYVMNTHLDHEFEEARALGLKMVLETAADMQQVEALPAFLLGDFNFEPQDAPYALVAQGPFTDLTRDMDATFHDFGRGPGMKIDYILTNRPGERYTVGRWHEEHQGVYLSDHDAVTVCWHDSTH